MQFHFFEGEGSKELGSINRRKKNKISKTEPKTDNKKG